MMWTPNGPRTFLDDKPPGKRKKGSPKFVVGQRVRVNRRGTIEDGTVIEAPKTSLGWRYTYNVDHGTHNSNHVAVDTEMEALDEPNRTVNTATRPPQVKGPKKKVTPQTKAASAGAGSSGFKQPPLDFGK